MLTNRDYCDYELVLELKELGYDYIRREGLIHLYDAQKWLREEKKIIVEATFNLMYKGQPRFSWRILGTYYTLDLVMSKEDYDSYEEAFSEGIKEAVKILKENK